MARGWGGRRISKLGLQGGGLWWKELQWERAPIPFWELFSEASRKLLGSFSEASRKLPTCAPLLHMCDAFVCEEETVMVTQTDWCRFCCRFICRFICRFCCCYLLLNLVQLFFSFGCSQVMLVRWPQF